MAFPGSQQTPYLSINLDRVYQRMEDAALEVKGFRHGVAMTALTTCFPSMTVPPHALQLGIPFLALLSASCTLTLPLALCGYTVSPHFMMRKLRHREYVASSRS